MTAGQIAFIGAAAAVVLFVFGPGWVRALAARVRPEPLAPYRWPIDQEVGE